MPRLLPPDKAAILALPPFEGLGPAQIRLPRSPAELADAEAALVGQTHLGFDTEAKPTFVKGQASTGPDLVQFATASQAWLFQLRHPGCEDLVRRLLAAPGIVKVGFDLQQDQSQLQQRLGQPATPVLDLVRVFHRRGYPRTIGIKSAVAIVFGQRLVKSKRVTTSNWSLERLSTAQQVYAANDAHVALRVMLALGLSPAELAATPAA